MPDRELCRYWFVFVCVIVEDFSATMANYGDEAGVSDTCDQKKGTGKGTEKRRNHKPIRRKYPGRTCAVM